MEEKNCITCSYLKTGKHNICKKRRGKNREIFDIFYYSCPKYEFNGIKTVRDGYIKAKVKEIKLENS